MTQVCHRLNSIQAIRLTFNLPRDSYQMQNKRDNRDICWDFQWVGTYLPSITGVTVDIERGQQGHQLILVSTAGCFQQFIFLVFPCKYLVTMINELVFIYSWPHQITKCWFLIIKKCNLCFSLSRPLIFMFYVFNLQSMMWFYDMR